MSSPTTLGYTATWAGQIFKGFFGPAVEKIVAQHGLMVAHAFFFTPQSCCSWRSHRAVALRALPFRDRRKMGFSH
jgi:hypothetical protein